MSVAQSTDRGWGSIDKQNAQAIVGFLASDALKGRNAGSEENKIVVEYLVSKLKEIGISPLKTDYTESFLAINKGKRWSLDGEIPDENKVQLSNVYGMIPGENTAEYLVIGAHFDHLGMDENREGDKIFNGADDNASGVSAVLQIAKAMQLDGNKPKRTVIFAFWDGEEKGLLGSEYFMRSSAYSIKSYLNFDMIGRNTDENNPHTVTFLYTKANKMFENWVRKSTEEKQMSLQPIYKPWDNPIRGSDNASFAKRGVPILWFHTDGHTDYHQTSDELHKINWEKLVEITKVAYLISWEMANDDY